MKGCSPQQAVAPGTRQLHGGGGTGTWRVLCALGSGTCLTTMGQTGCAWGRCSTLQFCVWVPSSFHSLTSYHPEPTHLSLPGTRATWAGALEPPGYDSSDWSSCQPRCWALSLWMSSAPQLTCPEKLVFLREVDNTEAGHKSLKPHSITHGGSGIVGWKEGCVSLVLIL